MDGRTITAAVIATVGVLAVALAAATLTTTVAPDGGFGADGGDAGEGFGSPPPSADRPVDAFGIPFVRELALLLVLLAVVVASGYALVYWREALPALVGFVAIVGLVWLLSTLVSSPFPPFDPPTPGPTNGSGILGGGSGDDGPGSGVTTPTPLFALLLAVVALVGVLFVFARSSPAQSRLLDRSDGADGTEPEVAALGRTAGRAADRIERDGTPDADAAFDNDVYRAWREMSALLDVPDPETTTPQEFATAAVDAGMASDDVRELTRLFEDVRYGGYEPTGDRERRAVRVFRRIETAYAPGES